MERKPSLRDFLNIVFKHKIGVCLIFVLITMTITVLTYIYPFSYEASAKILMKFARGNIPVAGTSSLPSAILTVRQTEEELLSEIEILNNKYLIERVVRHLWDDLTRVTEDRPTSIWGRTKSFLKRVAHKAVDCMYRAGYFLDLIKQIGPFEAQVISVQKNLSIEAIKGSNIIKVKYRCSNPELGAVLVNTLTEYYLEHHIEVHKIQRAYGFFQDQKTLLQNSLREQENTLRDFKHKWNIADVGTQKVLLLQSLSQKLIEQEDLKGRVTESQERTASLRESLAHRTNYQSPNMISAAVVASDPVYGDLLREILRGESKQAGWLAKSKLQESNLEYYRARLNNLNDKETELHRLERERDILEDNYKRYLTRLEETRISGALDMEQISNVSIIEPAVVPSSPIRRIPFLPRRVFHILVGTIMGLLVGLGYAFLAEQLDRTFGSREEAEEILNIPCLVSIPRE